VISPSFCMLDRYSVTKPQHALALQVGDGRKANCWAELGWQWSEQEKLMHPGL
jgi:hypothetical protein